MEIHRQLTRYQRALRVITLALPLLGWLGTVHAQETITCNGSKGNSLVAVPTITCSSGVAASMAYVDVAGLIGTTPPSNDMCYTINGILKGSSIPAAGAVVDARGINVSNAAQDSTFSSALACAYDPYNGPFGAVTVPSVILLPPGGIATSVTWVMPSNSRLLGVFPLVPGTTETAIQPSASFSPGGAPPAGIAGVWYDFPKNSLIQMCANTGCTGISIEHMVLDAGGSLPTAQFNNGIYNSGAGDQSYVNDVTVNNVAYNAVFIGQSAGGSGPYSNINVNIELQAGSEACSSASPAQCPACVVMLASTRGLHGLTCIGNSSTATQPAAGSYDQAGVYIVASNNSVKDVHVESFWDGVQLFAGNGAMSNVHVSNVTGAATVNNTGHICGKNANTTLFGGCYKYTSASTITDVSLLGISDELNGSGAGTGGWTAAVLDDTTNTAFAATGSSNPAASSQSVGLYVIGENISTATSPQYARFTTKPNNTSSSTQSPIWASAALGSTSIANTTCVNDGALFSNTTGSTSNILYVCRAGNWINIH